ncbi:MAG TPA: hypothetical protein VFI25_05930 [Planctomycetota bacterium]|nr:hypothetical protein [Planctomycetota bacterium]
MAGIYLAARSSKPEAEAPALPQPDGTALIEGTDYRVMVAVARIKPEKPGGEKWDSGRSSTAAPDPFYEIWWRGNRVFKSQEVQDVLVASWSNVALPELVHLIADAKVSLETIKEGALITARWSDAIQVRIYDDDPLNDDLIEEFTLGMNELRVGDQVREGRRGLESATIRVIPRDTQQLRHFIR